MRAFVEIRKILLKENDLKEQLKEITNQVYDAMENCLMKKRRTPEVG